MLDGADESLPEFWSKLTQLGWLGLHLPEEHGGSGYGLEELAVVVEQLGRVDAPGPFVPTVIVSAVINAAADDATKAAWLPRLADGSLTGAAALDGDVTISGGSASGSAGVVLGGALAKVLLVAVGDDVAIVEDGFDPEALTGSPMFELLIDMAAWQIVVDHAFTTFSWKEGTGGVRRRSRTN